MIGGRPPEYDEARWRVLRSERPAGFAALLGLLAVFAASIAWLMVLVPARGTNLRMQPIAWLMLLPAAVWLASGLLSYRPRAIRFLRPAYILAPIVAGAAAIAETLLAHPELSSSDPGFAASIPVLSGLAVITLVLALLGALAFHFSSLQA
jgi:hypothetical protein